jgi:hypothetical protein
MQHAVPVLCCSFFSYGKSSPRNNRIRLQNLPNRRTNAIRFACPFFPSLYCSFSDVSTSRKRALVMANSLQGAIDSTSRVYQTEEQMQHAVPVLCSFSFVPKRGLKLYRLNSAKNTTTIRPVTPILTFDVRTEGTFYDLPALRFRRTKRADLLSEQLSQHSAKRKKLYLDFPLCSRLNQYQLRKENQIQEFVALRFDSP